MSYQKTLCALADPTRQAILASLRDKPQPVGILATRFPVSRPAISQHLKVLSDAGLVTSHPKGNKRYYSLAPGGIRALRAYLDTLWDDALTAFAEEAHALARKENQ